MDVARAAAGLAAIAAIAGAKPLARARARSIEVGCAVLAAILSLAYVAFYLRGGPRIIDATSYFLEARALSEGHLAWAAPEPASSVAGRFLVRDTLAGGANVGVIFPPGYPAVLAIGFRLGAPLVIGPILGAALVLLTARVARGIARAEGWSASRTELARKVAALLATTCACLRYHTADTMSHGLAAVCFSGALLAALAITSGERTFTRPARHRNALVALALGLALGWLAATRPFSAPPCALAVVYVLGASRSRALVGRNAALVVLGVAPGLALLVLHQHATTGGWFRSSQALYYASSDGPPGCFRYGFGTGIGCRLEHGDFVDHNLRNGFDALAAVKTTLRRLKMHAGDALNAWPLAPIALGAMASAARQRASRVLAIGVGAIVLAYAPFYFDGNYPGGGARFYADTLPLELTAIALVASKLVDRLDAAPSVLRRARHAAVAAPLALSLAGFAAIGGADHALLRDREGGRPMFEPRVAELAPEGALLFMDTDHGFDLAFDPDARRLEAVRYRGDWSDWAAWSAHGAPPAFRYDDAVDGSRPPGLVPYVPDASRPLEGESLWPPLEQEGGWAAPAFVGCASSGKWIALAGAGDRVAVTFAFPRAATGAELEPRVAGTGRLAITCDGREIVAWRAEPSRGEEGGCSRPLDRAAVPACDGDARLRLERSGAAPFALDAIRISGRPPAAREGG